MDDIKNHILKWNNLFPIDFWWRKKHGIAFGSKKHKEVSFFNQKFEYFEEKLFNNFFEDINSNDNWLKKQKTTKNLIDEAREELNNLPKEF